MQVRNSITLIGNLGGAPEVKTTDAGLTITKFSLATNEYYRDKDGNRQTRTDWHKVVAFGKLAEVFAQHLHQGSQVCIAGRLSYNKWIDKYDQVRNTAEVVAHSFTFLSGGRQGESYDQAEAAPSVAAEPKPGYGKSATAAAKGRAGGKAAADGNGKPAAKSPSVKAKTGVNAATGKATPAAKSPSAKAKTGVKAKRSAKAAAPKSARKQKMDPTGADLPF